MQHKQKSSTTPALKPSSMGYECLRRLYYDFFKVKPDRTFTGKEQLIFKTGSALHDMLQKILADTGLLLKYKDEKGNEEIEFTVSDEELHIKKGKIDGVLLIDNKLYLLEIKTINSRKFEKLTAPTKEHLHQGELYKYLFKKCLDSGKYKHIKELDGYTEITSMIYLYICKDNADMKEWEIPYTSDIIETILDKAAIFVTEHIMPGVLPAKNKAECTYCVFKSKCTKDFNPKESI